MPGGIKLHWWFTFCKLQGKSFKMVYMWIEKMVIFILKYVSSQICSIKRLRDAFDHNLIKILWKFNFAGIIYQNQNQSNISKSIFSSKCKTFTKKTFANYELNYFPIGFLHLLIFEPLSPKISNEHVHSRFQRFLYCDI